MRVCREFQHQAGIGWDRLDNHDGLHELKGIIMYVNEALMYGQRAPRNSFIEPSCWYVRFYSSEQRDNDPVGRRRPILSTLKKSNPQG
jgi:hypothetical protein